MELMTSTYASAGRSFWSGADLPSWWRDEPSADHWNTCRPELGYSGDRGR